jgi:hypothetical protein
MSVLRSILAAFRRFFSRRAARRLLAENAPKGLRDQTLRPALPRLPDHERWTASFRLVALPPPLEKLAVVREIPPRSMARRLRLPKRLEIPPPLESAVKDVGAARPRNFRLDGDLRLPAEIDPLRLAGEKSPTRTRRVRPRTPLARAPIQFRLRPRSFRLDTNSLKPANEGIVPLEMRDTSYRWVRPAFRRRWLELHWMAQERIAFLGPLSYEWFQMWWDQYSELQPGAKEPYEYEPPPEIDWAQEHLKEQMLIRRDVKKDENAPEPQELHAVEVGVPIAALEHEPLSALIPEKPWVDPARPLPPPTVPRMAREAYLQWRTLVDALEER